MLNSINNPEQKKLLESKALSARLKFKEEIDLLPKMSPAKLIMLIGGSQLMSAIDNAIVNIGNPKVQVEPNFVPPGERI